MNYHLIVEQKIKDYKRIIEDAERHVGETLSAEKRVDFLLDNDFTIDGSREDARLIVEAIERGIK